MIFERPNLEMKNEKSEKLGSAGSSIRHFFYASYALMFVFGCLGCEWSVVRRWNNSFWKAFDLVRRGGREILDLLACFLMNVLTWIWC